MYFYSIKFIVGFYPAQLPLSLTLKTKPVGDTIFLLSLFLIFFGGQDGVSPLGPRFEPHAGGGGGHCVDWVFSSYLTAWVSSHI